MNTAKSDDKTINPEPRMTRTRSFSSNSCEFMAKHSRDDHPNFSKRHSRTTAEVPLIMAGSKLAGIPREEKPNKSRNLCREPFPVAAISYSAKMIWRALGWIPVCQR
jgi:hypothetical protein